MVEKGWLKCFWMENVFLWEILKVYLGPCQKPTIKRFVKIYPWILCRQKQPLEVFCKKSVLRNFAKFTGKHLCQSLFFNKFASLRSATLLKKRIWHRCFPVNFGKFSRRLLLQNTSRRLLLCWPLLTKRVSKALNNF